MPSPHRSLLGLVRFDLGEDTIRLGAPVSTAGKPFAAFAAEQAVIGKICYPGLALGGALRRPRRQAGLAHGLGDFANLFAAAAAMFDHALEEIRTLLFPI